MGSELKIGIEHLEGALEINKQLLKILETYIKKAGEWSGPMIANMTSARDSLETQVGLVEALKKFSSLDNLS